MGCESDQEVVQAVVGGGFGARKVDGGAGAGGGGLAADAATGEGAAALAALLVPSVQVGGSCGAAQWLKRKRSACGEEVSGRREARGRA